MRSQIILISLLISLMLFSGACSRVTAGPEFTPVRFVPELTPTSTPTESPTPFQPSPTPLPLAALVNGASLELADYQAELARYQAASGNATTPDEEKQVLDDLVNQILLAQGAFEEGFVADEALVQERITQLTAELGGDQLLQTWMAAHGYTGESFRKDLARGIAASWMRDKIITALPATADQVHARQILTYEADKANEALAQLQSGKEFATLAADYDPITKGDLGWFPRGYLLNPQLDEVVFSLEPGKYSSVLEDTAGFHIIQVIERDPQRLLNPDARLTLQNLALQNWLQTRRNQSQIQILLP